MGTIGCTNTLVRQCINAEAFPFIRCMLVVSTLICIALIVTRSVLQLFILRRLLDFVVHPVYLCLYAKQARTFYKTLKWRSVEFKVRGRSSQMVRRSIKSCYHFAFIMSLMEISFLSVFWVGFFRYTPSLLRQQFIPVPSISSPLWDSLLSAITNFKPTDRGSTHL